MRVDRPIDCPGGWDDELGRVPHKSAHCCGAYNECTSHIFYRALELASAWRLQCRNCDTIWHWPRFADHVDVPRKETPL